MKHNADVIRMDVGMFLLGSFTSSPAVAIMSYPINAKEQTPAPHNTWNQLK